MWIKQEHFYVAVWWKKSGGDRCDGGDVDPGPQERCAYRALVLETHHERAHVPGRLVVNDDHGLVLRDGPHVVSPLCHCRGQGGGKEENTGSEWGQIKV